MIGIKQKIKKLPLTVVLSTLVLVGAVGCVAMVAPYFMLFTTVVVAISASIIRVMAYIVDGE